MVRRTFPLGDHGSIHQTDKSIMFNYVFTNILKWTVDLFESSVCGSISSHIFGNFYSCVTRILMQATERDIERGEFDFMPIFIILLRPD